MIKVVVFDYAGVVADSPMVNWAKNTLHPNPEKLSAYRAMTNKWDRGMMPLERVFAYLSELTGIKENEIMDKLYGRYKPNKEVIELIKKLKKTHKIFLFSNFVSHILNHLLKENDLIKYFDQVIISSDYGVKKPDPEFFKILLEKAGVKKDEIVFIDDMKENVGGGNNFGIKSFLFTDIKILENDLKNVGINI